MNRLSGSIRTRSAHQTYDAIHRYAPQFGITRITDITHLDRIGVPVFASIRPGAAEGSLCVHNGKGAQPMEAKVGALMEAIEFELADPKWNRLEIIEASVKEIESTYGDGMRFHDFGLRLGTRLEYAERLPAVAAYSLFDQRRLLVPAELVFMPFKPPCSRALFGASTNGLASGNTYEEACVHALCELLERDVSSFEYIRPASRRVAEASFPVEVHDTVTRIKQAGMEVVARYTPNEFGLPFFRAYVLEQSDTAPIAVSGGYGLHPIAAIALSRAITEAVQSRLTCIHGGRDDLIERFQFLESRQGNFEVQANRRTRARVLEADRAISFEAIPDHARHIDSIQDCALVLQQALVSNGFTASAVVRLSQPDWPFAVVKIIIPKLEFYDPRVKRVGPRMLNALREKLSIHP